MTSILFKRLFEVRFLHEYYLIDREQGGALFFSKTPVQRQTYLNKIIEQGAYNILNDLDFEPTPETVQTMRGYRLKFGRNATGFLIGAEVRAEQGSGGIERYKLLTPPKKGLRFSFYVRVKNHLFKSFTALRLRPEEPAAFHFFSNAGKQIGSSPLVNLAEPPFAFEPGRTYEPGELAIVTGILQEATMRTQSTAATAWVPVGGEGYANERDRQALGKQFRWQWGAEPQTVQFSLLDETLTGDEAKIKTITTVFTEQNKIAALDFSRKHPAPGQRVGNPIPDGFYIVEAKGTFDTFVKRLYLHNELSAGNPPAPRPGVIASPPGLLGIVQITVADPTESAPFLDEDGYILRQALPGSTSLSHTIYEVRWLSRSTWWRYRSDRDLGLKAIGAAVGHLTANGKDLVSTKPQRYQARQSALSPGVYLPNPLPDKLRPDANGRYYSDILVSKIPNLIDNI